MPIRIIERTAGGGVLVHIPAYNDLARPTSYPGDTDDALVQRIIDRHNIVDYFLVDDVDDGIDAFLGDRTYRDAWEMVDGELTVNMAKAREIHMGRIRESRNAALIKLDISWTLATESRDRIAQDNVAREKQLLRDIPQRFDLTTARTPADLARRWPTNLDRGTE